MKNFQYEMVLSNNRASDKDVNTKLGTLAGSECVLLPRVHDELGGSILLEGLLQIVLEHSVETCKGYGSW